MKRIEATLDSIGINDRLTIIKIKYALEIIKNEFSKLVILGIFFYIIGDLTKFLFSIAILLPIRVFSGGMHMKSNIGCFLYSLVFFVLSINIFPMIPASNSLLIFILALSSIIIIALSPIQNLKRPINTRERYLFLKSRSILLVVTAATVLSVLYFLGNTSFVTVGIWIVCLQAMQMIIARINIKGKEIKTCLKDFQKS